MRLAGPVQAQEPRAARLAFRARAARLDGADVDRARSEEGSLLRGWVMRRTVHLFPSEDASWMLDLFAPALARQARKRMNDYGLDRDGQDRALELLRRAVTDDGPLTRPELGRRLDAAGVHSPQEVKVHLWVLATLDGELCLGPDRGGHTCLVHARDWLGEQPKRERDDALAEFARRFIGAYGPADDRDLARWSGLGLGECRTAIERIAGELAEVRCGESTLLEAKRRRRSASARRPIVRMLGAFDNYNLGYVDRGFAIDDHDLPQVVPGGGIIRATLTVDGRFAGTWSSKRNGARLAVTIEPFTPLGDEVAEAIAAEVVDIGRFEGLEAGLTADTISRP